MLPEFCNQSSHDHNSPKKNKPSFVNIKNTLFKSPNSLRLAACLALAILLNVLILAFYFRDSPASTSSLISLKFDAPVFEQDQFIEAPVVKEQIEPSIIEGQPPPEQIEASAVEYNQSQQNIEAPFVEKYKKPEKFEAPAVNEQIEAPIIKGQPPPQPIEATAVEFNQSQQNIEAPFVEQQQQPENFEAPVVDEHQQFQGIQNPTEEQNHLSENIKAPAVEQLEYCKSGKVFVYDLPSTYNKDLLNDCQALDPWHSRCNAMTNGGFGPKATGLESVVPKNLEPAWFWTDMYSAEVIYHSRMLNYKCRTENPEEATAFYVPFYVGFAVGKYLWGNYTSKDRDRHAELVLDWVKNQPSWKKFNGSDHFLVFGRLTWDFRRLTNNDSEWGSSIMYMPLVKNVLKVSVERNPWDQLEISVPYPTAFHPRSESDILEWQSYIRNRKRNSPFCFVGATRNKIKNDFRGVLMNYCKNESDSCRVVDCSVTRCYDGAPAILEAFLDSDFCLQPKGDGFTRRSFFDCMLAGSIPVYFWRRSFEDQYQWHLPLTGRTSSVFIDKDVVRNDSSIIRKVLEGYSKEEISMMRENVIDMIPRFLYAMSTEGLGGNSSTKDAFDITIEGILRKFQKRQWQRRRLY